MNESTDMPPEADPGHDALPDSASVTPPELPSDVDAEMDFDDDMDESLVVLTLHRDDLEQLIPPTEPPRENREYTGTFGFGEIHNVMDHIGNLCIQVEGVWNIVKHAPETIEILDTDDLEEHLDCIVDSLASLEETIRRIQKADRKANRWAWLWNRCRSRTDDRLDNVPLSKLDLPENINQYLAPKITTLNGLSLACEDARSLFDLGLTISDVETIKSCLRRFLRLCAHRIKKGLPPCE